MYPNLSAIFVNPGKALVAKKDREYGPNAWGYIGFLADFDNPPVSIKPINLINARREDGHDSELEKRHCKKWRLNFNSFVKLRAIGSVIWLISTH